MATPHRLPPDSNHSARRPANQAGKYLLCVRPATPKKAAPIPKKDTKVDEEHDPAYKSDRTPRLQARDAAVELGRLAGAAVVLGSATPAVESVGHAESGRYRRFDLPGRPIGAEPVVEVVDLRLELQGGNRGLISRRLRVSVARPNRTASNSATAANGIERSKSTMP